jgi:hypothetical protein
VLATLAELIAHALDRHCNPGDLLITHRPGRCFHAEAEKLGRFTGPLLDCGELECLSMVLTSLASQEGMNAALSLEGEDALTLVNILDQVSRPAGVWLRYLIMPTQAFEAPGMSLDLRRRSVRILRRVCGLQTILPRSCILSENISKGGDIAWASGRFTDVWKGRNNGNLVCIKAFKTYGAN